jgi:acylphosphatase
MTNRELSRVHIRVRGRVQGVGFRAFVAQSGMIMGLTGWVRNVAYDQVETVAEGERAILEKFIEVIRTGPRASRVDECRVEWEIPSGDFTSFEVSFSR